MTIWGGRVVSGSHYQAQASLSLNSHSCLGPLSTRVTGMKIIAFDSKMK